MTSYDTTQDTQIYGTCTASGMVLRDPRTLRSGSGEGLCSRIQYLGQSTETSRDSGCQGDSGMARDREGMEEFELDNTI